MRAPADERDKRGKRILDMQVSGGENCYLATECVQLFYCIVEEVLRAKIFAKILKLGSLQENYVSKFALNMISIGLYII